MISHLALALTLLRSPAVALAGEAPAEAVFDAEVWDGNCALRKLKAIRKSAFPKMDQCAMLALLRNKLDLSSFPSSLEFDDAAGEKSGGRAPSDLHRVQTAKDCSVMEIILDETPEAAWRYAFKPSASGDWTGRGRLEMLILFEDQAMNGGSYDVSEPLLLEQQDDGWWRAINWVERFWSQTHHCRKGAAMERMRP